ncbi:DUF2065 domain-containing protein [uncultured Paraglaciecola sp.]|uniref:DUF2065 domain-containing protein n=1 Tax=uncultured Paraglaciecola sp. TaxID=1765024 RepID=UPI0030D99167|tara:strand:+ start:195932 stop:196126 length:195 start_codon:yes stop_codon:yes gene_type:complete
MYSFGEVILMAIAMVLVVEGVGPMLFAKKWQRFLQQISQQPVNQLRSTGGILVTVGVVSLFYLL